MENKTTLIFFSTLLILSCFRSHGLGTRDFHFLKQKLKINAGIDKNLFNASELFHYFSKPVANSSPSAKEKDLITKLPGQPPVINPFKQYGGYVTVNEKAGRAFFYYFVEANQSYANKWPLLLWLNGGPGCSSLGYGAMEEIGPFRVHNDTKTLYRNEYSWNRVANVLFLETPAGVGFSYSKDRADLEGGNDTKAAVDNFRFFMNWLERFPEYKGRDLYLAGESYAGHYMPQLAHMILYYNKMAKKTIINLKGIMLGNAELNDETDNKGMYQYFGSHALISGDLANQVLRYCTFSPNGNESPKCNKAMDEADKVYDEKIDIYNLYAPLCSDHNPTNKPKFYSVSNFDPCTDHYVKAYLNRPDVQKALHANVTNIPYEWNFCSGDIDGRLPVTSTQLTIKQMKLPVKISWYPWYLLGEV
ncbi:serine carboxypeptidase [Striga asiatica]|uniref:Carboxypeptidase n=1 Tax=Striga asiatica TaxID=4170 RepID=A0A5A7QU93_STRAF|nr:serine carboxypeptidase [Striga asiatica]